MKVPPQRKLLHMFRKKVTLEKYSIEESTDSYGQTEETLVGSYQIDAEIQEVTAEDLVYMRPGVVEVGDAWGYFLPSYLVQGQTVTVEVEDIVKWNNKAWRIDRIEDYYLGGQLMYKRALMKRVV
jgi:type IV secretory pathway TrbF-like protein